MAMTLAEAWEKLFPARGEYTGQGFPTPPGGETPPPKGTKWNMYINGKWYEAESSGKAGIMPRLTEIPWAGPPGTELELDVGETEPGAEPEPEPVPGEPTPAEKEAFEERYGVPYPTLTLPRYQAFGAEYPVSDLPIYQPFPTPYPTLELPVYEQFPVEFPELPPLYGEAGDVISRMLRGEGLGLPVEELMAAYTEEERLAMEEYMPGLREYWAGKNLLRSGMEREAEREATRKAGAARGTYRAQLEKESIIRQQDGIVTGVNLAMQHVGIGYGAQRDAWQAAMNEYTKVYASEINVGTAEFDASTRAWDAAMREYTKAFSSEVAKTEFGQRIQEAAFNVARDEYQRVYQSSYSGTGDEYAAQTQGFEAAWREFDTFRRLLFDWGTMQAGYDFEFEFQSRSQAFQFEFLQMQQDFTRMLEELRHDFDMELQHAGYNDQQRNSLWNTFLNVAGWAILGWIF